MNALGRSVSVTRSIYRISWSRISAGDTFAAYAMGYNLFKLFQAGPAPWGRYSYIKLATFENTGIGERLLPEYEWEAVQCVHPQQS